MPRPRLLDLFCGAGGASVGYWQAGFQVIGVDIKPQRRYPFQFVQADAMDFDLRKFDAIHASPPCQDHSNLKSRHGDHGTGWMLEAMLERLSALDVPWVVENVSTAKNRADFLLCGEMFGLRTIRHRRFTLNPMLPILLSEPYHAPHRRRTDKSHSRAGVGLADVNLSVTGHVSPAMGPAALGIDWMTGRELSQAIPPAYTRFIGEQLIKAV